MKRSAFLVIVLGVIFACQPICGNAAPKNKVQKTMEEGQTNDEKVKIKVSDETIACFQAILESGNLDSIGYKPMQIQQETDISTGDLMMQNNMLYVCIKIDGQNTWWSISDDTFTVFDEISYQAELSIVYHKTMNETAHPIITDLAGIKGKKLSSVLLPSNYKWVDEEKVMEKIGVQKFKAYYIPEDLINDKTKIIELEVAVEEASDVPEFHDRYVVKYVPHLKASMVGITDNWKVVSPDKDLKMGENTATIAYRFPNGVTVKEKIKIIVEKGDLQLNGVMITVIEGTKLNDGLLPKMSNGKLSFGKDKGKVVLQNTTAKCKFTPTESDKYNEIENVSVIINVIPKTMVNPTKPDKEEEEDPESTEEQENQDDNTDDDEETDNTDDNGGNNSGNEENTPSDSGSSRQPIDVDSSKTDNTGNQTNTNNTNNNTGNNTGNQTANGNTTGPTSTGNQQQQVAVASTKKDQMIDAATETKAEKQIQTHDIDLTSTKTQEKGPKIQVKDIELTKTDAAKETVKPKKHQVKTVTLVKKAHTETDATTEKMTTEEATTEEEVTATEAATSTDSSEDSTTEDSDSEETVESQENNDIKMILVILGATVILAGVGIFAYKTIRKSKLR